MSVYRTPLMESQDLESADLAKTQTAQNTQSGRRHATQAAVVFNPVGASPISHTLELDMPKIDIKDMNSRTAQMIEDISRNTEKEYEEALREYYLRLRDGDFTLAPKDLWVHGEWWDSREPNPSSETEHSYNVDNIWDRASIAYVRSKYTLIEDAPFSMALSDKESELDGSPQYWWKPYKYLLNETPNDKRSLNLHYTHDLYLKIKVPGVLTYRSEYDEHGEFVQYIPVNRGTDWTVDISSYAPDAEWYMQLGNAEIVEGEFTELDQTWELKGFIWYYEIDNPTNKMEVYLDHSSNLHITNNSVFTRFITLHMYRWI